MINPPFVLTAYGAVPVTPRPLANYIITVGGIAIIVAQGPISGGWIQNPFSAESQNIGEAESIFLSQSVVPGLIGNGPVAELVPGQSFSLINLSGLVIVRVNAASSGHTIAGEIW
jgi:hypothetical protein